MKEDEPLEPNIDAEFQNIENFEIKEEELPPTTDAEFREIANQDKDMIETYNNEKVGWKPSNELFIDLSVN